MVVEKWHAVPPCGAVPPGSMQAGQRLFRKIVRNIPPRSHSRQMAAQNAVLRWVSPAHRAASSSRAGLTFRRTGAPLIDGETGLLQTRTASARRRRSSPCPSPPGGGPSLHRRQISTCACAAEAGRALVGGWLNAAFCAAGAWFLFHSRRGLALPRMETSAHLLAAFVSAGPYCASVSSFTRLVPSSYATSAMRH